MTRNPHYREGEVVDGHVWTGSEWERLPPSGAGMKAFGLFLAVVGGVLGAVNFLSPGFRALSDELYRTADSGLAKVLRDLARLGEHDWWPELLATAMIVAGLVLRSKGKERLALSEADPPPMPGESTSEVKRTVVLAVTGMPDSRPQGVSTGPLAAIGNGVLRCADFRSRATQAEFAWWLLFAG